MIKIRDKLSGATKSVHHRLHEHPVLSVLISDHISLADYNIALAGFERFYTEVACKIEEYETALPECIRDNLEHLRADLAHLPQSYAMPKCEIRSIPADEDSLLGWLYVIEGSQLGGQAIAKHIRRHLNITPENGGSFFAGHGRKTAKRWLSFLEKLDQQAQNHEACCNSAYVLFSDLERYFWRIAQSKNNNTKRVSA